VNAAFLALAFTAALNPKLLGLDLLLIENRRPRAIFLCLLLGGMTVALAIGLLDVLTVHSHCHNHLRGARGARGKKALFSAYPRDL
jgi:hypothetical protein